MKRRTLLTLAAGLPAALLSGCVIPPDDFGPGPGPKPRPEGPGYRENPGNPNNRSVNGPNNPGNHYGNQPAAPPIARVMALRATRPRRRMARSPVTGTRLMVRKDLMARAARGIRIPITDPYREHKRAFSSREKALFM